MVSYKVDLKASKMFCFIVEYVLHTNAGARTISTAATSTTASPLPTLGPSIGNNFCDIVSSKGDALFDRKIRFATEGLQPFLVSRLKQLPQENALTIVDYTISMKNEINLSDNYRKLNIYTL